MKNLLDFFRNFSYPSTKLPVYVLRTTTGTAGRLSFVAESVVGSARGNPSTSLRTEGSPVRRSLGEGWIESIRVRVKLNFEKNLLLFLLTTSLAFSGQSSTKLQFNFHVPKQIDPTSIAIDYIHRELIDHTRPLVNYKVSNIEYVEIQKKVFVKIIFEKYPHVTLYYYKDRTGSGYYNLIGTLENVQLHLEEETR